MRHALGWSLHVVAAVAAAGGLRTLWLVARTPSPGRAPDEARLHWQIGEASPRANRLRLASVGLLGLAVVLLVVARWVTRPAG